VLQHYSSPARNHQFHLLVLGLQAELPVRALLVCALAEAGSKAAKLGVEVRIAGIEMVAGASIVLVMPVEVLH
jgi:hypothetical protein